MIESLFGIWEDSVKRPLTFVAAMALTCFGVMASTSGCTSCSSESAGVALAARPGSGSCESGGNSAPGDGPQCELDLNDLAVISDHVVARLEQTNCDVPATATVVLTIEYVAPGTNPLAPVTAGSNSKSGPTPIPGFNTLADCRPGTFTGVATITGEGDNGALIVEGAPDETDAMTISSYSLCE
jgi:hypothetical protein